MQPLTKSSSQPRNPTESLNNTPACKCGWLYKRGMLFDYFIIKSCPEEYNKQVYLSTNLNNIVLLDLEIIIKRSF